MVATKEPNDITEISLAYFETKEPESKQSYTNEELEIMAHVMNGEAGNVKNDEWVLYYGSVVLNRVKHPQFPNTIKEVVFQRNPLQYACTVDGNYDRQPPQRM
jgi:N-acetylmuramoyl-L-alanine amidase